MKNLIQHLLILILCVHTAQASYENAKHLCSDGEFLTGNDITDCKTALDIISDGGGVTDFQDLSWNATSNFLSISDGTGDTISGFQEDIAATNCPYGIQTISDNGAVTCASDNNTDNYANSLSFSTSTGVLTIGRSGALLDLTEDLDGRYRLSSQTITLTGDVTGSGTTSIATNISANTVGATELTSTSVTSGSYTTADITVDEDGRITSASSGTVTESDTLDDVTGRGNSTTNTINAGGYTEGGSDMLSNNISGNAATATALQSNGSNCSTGEFAQGVDTQGNAEGCGVPAASGGGIILSCLCDEGTGDESAYFGNICFDGTNFKGCKRDPNGGLTDGKWFILDTMN